MTRRIDQREQAITRLTQHILSTGLAETSLRQLAAAAGVSDRMLLYYFKNKSDILTEVLRGVAVDIAIRLEAGLPEGKPLSPADLFLKGAELTASPSLQQHMQVSLEIAAAAARGEEPFASIEKEIIEGFLVWVEKRLATKDPKRRRAQAAMILSMIDGLAILAVSGKNPEAREAVTEFARVLSVSQ